MDKIEKILLDNKLEIDKIEVPEELETCLHKALKNQPSPLKVRKYLGIKAAIILISIVITGYQYNTLAYYTKKMVGYDEIMSDSLKNLNELGKGQSIEKTYTFKNGVGVTLDGVMLDDTNFIAFYTVKDPSGSVDKSEFNPMGPIRGKKEVYLPRSSVGNINDEKTEAKYIVKCEIPAGSDKELTFNFGINGDNNSIDNGGISIVLDRSKAMGHLLKRNLNEKVNSGRNKIYLDSITASPTSTVVKGHIQNLLELALDQINKNRVRPISVNTKLIANGKEVEWQGSGMSTDMKGINFYAEYDALPVPLTELKLRVESFRSDYDTQVQAKLNKDIKNKSIQILDNNVEINKVYEAAGDTYVTITTEKDVVLTKVFCIMDDRKVELENTVLNGESINVDGISSYERTLHFKGSGDKLEFQVQRITCDKNLNKDIVIPVN